MMNRGTNATDLASIPLFPLPACVVLPGAILPLHVFEGRYRAMMDELTTRPESGQLIAMALLEYGFEHLPIGRQAPIHPTVCVGRVLQHIRREDGRYDLMLLGWKRANVLSEDLKGPYRRASLEVIETLDDLDAIDERAVISTIRALLYRLEPEPAITPAMLDQMLDAGASLPRILDLLSYYLLSPEDCDLKHRILSEPAVSVRSQILLRHLRRRVDITLRALERNLSDWPPVPCMN